MQLLNTTVSPGSITGGGSGWLRTCSLPLKFSEGDIPIDIWGRRKIGEPERKCKKSNKIFHKAQYFIFYFNLWQKYCFSRQDLMIAVNSFSSMFTIALTMPQFLHVVYDITVDRAPSRFSSHYCRNRWAILCLNRKKKQLPPSRPIFKNVCGGQTNICLLKAAKQMAHNRWVLDGVTP